MPERDRQQAAAEPLLWVSWEDHRRTRSLARIFGAELHEMAATLGKPGMVRYPLNIWATIALYRSRRPATVICQHPSFVLATLTVLLRRLFGYRVGLDAHNRGLAAEPGEGWLLRRAAVWLQRRADFVIVHNDFIGKQVAPRGGTVVVLPDPLPEISKQQPLRLEHPFNLLFICSFASDEPYQAVFEAMGALNQDIGVYVTGRTRKRVKTEGWSVNLVFCGRLSWTQYDQLLLSVNGVIDLTTREACLLCGAYEAVAAGKPMILSRTAALMEYFTQGAVFTDNTAGESCWSIPSAVQELRAREDELVGEVARLRDALILDWKRRKQELEALL